MKWRTIIMRLFPWQQARINGRSASTIAYPRLRSAG